MKYNWGKKIHSVTSVITHYFSNSEFITFFAPVYFEMKMSDDKKAN